MMNKTFIRGATFDLSGAVTVLDRGVRILNLTGWSVTSQIRTKTGLVLIQSLVCSWVDPTQSLVRVMCPTTTVLWTLGDAMMDIALTSPTGDVVFTKPVQFEIEESVTRL